MVRAGCDLSVGPASQGTVGELTWPKVEGPGPQEIRIVVLLAV